jgi:hypothetical protein
MTGFEPGDKLTKLDDPRAEPVVYVLTGRPYYTFGGWLGDLLTDGFVRRYPLDEFRLATPTTEDDKP